MALRLQFPVASLSEKNN